MIKKIVWQKYEDYLEESFEKYDDNISKNVMKKKDEKGDIENMDDDYSINPIGVADMYEDYDYPSRVVRSIPVPDFLIHGAKICSNFNSWIGHTNFPITASIAKKLDDDIEGVELFKPNTKYRFTIGIGKAFDFREVRQKIQEELGVST